MPRVEEKVEYIIDISDDESDGEDAPPAKLKAWMQAGTRGPRPIAGNKRVNSADSVSSCNSDKSTLSTTSSPAQSPSSEIGATASASGFITAAGLQEKEKKAFAEAWSTATPWFNPQSLEFGTQTVQDPVTVTSSAP